MGLAIILADKPIICLDNTEFVFDRKDGEAK